MQEFHAPADSRQGAQGEIVKKYSFAFVGNGHIFSDPILRTIDFEFEAVVAKRYPDLETWTLVKRNAGAAPSLVERVLFVDEAEMNGLAELVCANDRVLKDLRLVVAFRSDENGRALLAQYGDIIEAGKISLLPMNTNLGTWLQLVQLIDYGGRYVPPSLFARIPAPPTLQVPSGSDILPGDPGDWSEPDTQADADHGPRRDSNAGIMDTKAGASLTPREREVLTLVADGQPNKLIADELSLSIHTVKLHIHRIIKKLGVTNRTEAAIWHRENSGYG